MALKICPFVSAAGDMCFEAADESGFCTKHKRVAARLAKRGEKYVEELSHARRVLVATIYPQLRFIKKWASGLVKWTKGPAREHWQDVNGRLAKITELSAQLTAEVEALENEIRTQPV